MFDKQESREHSLPEELAALEKRLSEFTPAPPRVDRDRLMFAAGRAAAVAARTRPRWPSYLAEPSWVGIRFWQSATAMMTAATILLGATALWQGQWHDNAAKPQADHVAAATDSAIDQTLKGDANDFDQWAASRAAWPWSNRGPSGYLGVRYVALTRGVGALELEPAAATDDSTDFLPPATARELLKELLPGTMRRSS